MRKRRIYFVAERPDVMAAIGVTHVYARRATAMNYLRFLETTCRRAFHRDAGAARVWGATVVVDEPKARH